MPMEVLTEDDIKALVDVAVELKFAEKVKEFNEITIPFLAAFASGVCLAAMNYERSTGKLWTGETAKAFYDFMGKTQEFDPYVMGRRFINREMQNAVGHSNSGG